jgi:hypothetical protein
MESPIENIIIKPTEKPIEKTLKEKRHDYYIKNRDKLIALAIERRQKNPEKHQNYNKKYLEKNKEVYREMKNKQFTCEICNGQFTYSNYNRHILTNKHIKQI